MLFTAGFIRILLNTDAGSISGPVLLEATPIHSSSDRISLRPSVCIPPHANYIQMDKKYVKFQASFFVIQVLF